MARKDKVGSNIKKQAQHNLKEKRQAKKAKKAAGERSNPTLPPR
jgi:hypothetical protein